MIIYTLNIILFSAAFWLIYQLLLKKETFFTANRVYLLAAPVLALVLPLLSFEFFQFGTSEHQLFQIPAVVIGEWMQPANVTISSEATKAAGNPWSVFQVLALVYGLGVLVSLVLFLLKIRKLHKLKSSGKILFNGNVKIINILNSAAAFTFFSTIFLGENYSETEKIQIIEHELVHIQQKHSWDLVYFEALRILLWFNPFVYVFQRNIAEVHEFTADKKASETQSKKIYAQSLLNASFGTHQLSFTNPYFTKNSLKTRIIMLHKKSSNRFSSLKFLMVVPLVFLMLTYVACSEDEISDLQNSGKSKNIQPPKPPAPPAPKNIDGIEVPFLTLDKSPEFQNGSAFKVEGTDKNAFNDGIRNFVNKNFDTKKVESSADQGENKIYVQFVIGKDGKIQNVQARNLHPELVDEAKRVVEMLPQMKPGEMEGNPVDVTYTLPIIFQVD